MFGERVTIPVEEHKEEPMTDTYSVKEGSHDMFASNNPVEQAHHTQIETVRENVTEMTNENTSYPEQEQDMNEPSQESHEEIENNPNQTGTESAANRNNKRRRQQRPYRGPGRRRQRDPQQRRPSANEAGELQNSHDEHHD